MTTKKKLRCIERDLNGIIAAITQVSGRRARRARRVAQIAAGKIVGVASIGGMLMFISAVGTASTGAAIGALSGAAATSAQMYWIGSLFGMGAVAGAIIIPAIGFVLGLVAVVFISRALFGRPRKPERMQEVEIRALFASMRMIDPISRCLAEDMPEPKREELRILAHEGLLPLVDLIGSHLDTPQNNNGTDKTWQSFGETLALLPRRKLSRHHRRLKKLATKLAKPRRKSGLLGWLQSSSRSPSNA